MGKRIQLDDKTWQAFDLLARNSMKTFPKLADEAFADLLKEHNRPTGLKTVLKRSVPKPPAAIQPPFRSKTSRRARFANPSLAPGVSSMSVECGYVHQA